MFLADQVAHFVLLGFEVELVGGLGGDDGGEAFGDANAGEFEGLDLFGVVGHEADRGDAEEFEDFGRKLEVAAVGSVAEFEVGFDGVEALILELVGLQFGHEADAAAFLVFVEQNASAFVRDSGEREFELLAAVAAERVEDVAGKALGVDADDGRGAGGDVAHDERDGGFDANCGRWECFVAGLRIFDGAFEAEDAEVTPARGEVGIGHLANREKRHRLIIRMLAGGVSVRKRLRVRA